MPIKKIKVPFCASCGKPWLPEFTLADGTPNPVFDRPEKAKRCGKCKSTLWNVALDDPRRRKKPAQDSPEKITVEEPIIVLEVRHPKSQFLIENFPDPVAQEPEQPAPESVKTTLERFLEEVDKEGLNGDLTRETKGFFVGTQEPSARCRHGLYACPECHRGAA